MCFELTSCKSFLACAISLALIGCSGSNDEKEAKSKLVTEDQKVIVKTTETRTITAIDGYLVNATVCDDQNDNLVCDTGEEIRVKDSTGKTQVLTTNVKGQAEVPADANVIIKVIGEQTYDTDFDLHADQTYTLLAHSDTDIISPFTTLAALKNVDMDTLAAELNLNADLIKGDFVLAKSGADPLTAAESRRIHLVARSIVKLLPEHFSSFKDDASLSDELVGETVGLVQYAQQMTLDDIDMLVLEKTEDGQAWAAHRVIETSYPLPDTRDLEDELEQDEGRWYMGSTSAGRFAREGVKQLVMHDGVALVGDESIPYQVNRSVIVMGDKEIDVFETLDGLLLALDNSVGDLIFFSKYYDASTDLAGKFSAQALIAEPLYMIVKDNDNAHGDASLKRVELNVIEHTFKADGTGTLKYKGEDESIDTQWSVTDEGALKVQFNSAGAWVTETYYRSPSTHEVFVARAEMATTQPVIATYDKDSALLILQMLEVYYTLIESS
ncbi:hypothetical protein PRUB_b0734 [Pseudoalteromonas rubra]|uniref:Uncharacterized protein n=1 Tax=Pseudoalteromonas rubra TaxID=43658 RepID=A0A8T0C2D2_9GAMM|nr:hypothetical protein [Pseudoalteromonas rubra]KAF7781497.1 hypothetical protein PRUB_b0734 [Pseudoalteromonas rubra]